MIAVVFALLGAAANAAASVLQRKANRDESDERSMSLALIRDLLHRRVWFAGILAVIAGFLCQAVALGNGEISVVQPLLILELPLTLVLGSAVFHRRLQRRDWLAIAAMTVGLMAMLYSLRPTQGDPRHVPGAGWAIGVGVSLALVAALVGAGLRTVGPPRAALYGVATGTSFGLTAALLAATAAAYSGGIGAVFLTWQTYAMVVTGLLAMFLLQNAVQAGALVAAQPGFTLADPLIAILWGVVLFGERVRAGPWLIGILGGGALIAAGTLALIRSPLFEEHAGEPAAQPADAARPAG